MTLPEESFLLLVCTLAHLQCVYVLARAAPNEIYLSARGTCRNDGNLMAIC